MEFELIEHPPGDDREDDGDSAIIHDRPALNRRPPARGLDLPADDQAVWIPEQEDG